MLFTSYFGKVKKLGSKYKYYSIARITPKWFDGERMEDLAPSYNLLNAYKRGMDEITFSRKYLGEINQILDMDVIRRIADSKERIVLLCYERSEDFCHRHILAEFLRRRGISVREV